MKTFRAAITIGAVCLVLGCSDNSPTKPAPAPDYELQASAVIGPDGGSIGTPEFVLTVPAGAFDAAYPLGVYRASDSAVLPAITHRFLLRGLPLLYAEPLHVEVLQTDSVQTDKTMTVGRHDFVPATADTQLVTSFLSVADSSYWLASSLQATRVSGGSARLGGASVSDGGMSGDLIFEGRSGYHPLSSPTFEGCVPVGAAGLLTSTCLENALDSLVALGFDDTADGVSPFTGQINAGVEPTWNADVPGYAYLPRLGDRRALYLRFDPQSLSIGSQWSSTPFMPRAARVLCDMFAQIYDRNYGATSHLWFHKAVGLWAEQWFADNPHYLPPDFVGNERAVFDGLVYGAEGARSQTLHHGYGVAPMITYLVNRAAAGGNPTFISDVYATILGNIDPTAALLVTAPAPVDQWWPDFVAEYVAGHVWPIDVDSMLARNDGSGEFYSGGDTVLTFTGGMRDLSARLYRINLNRPGLSSTARVRFTLKAPNIADDAATIVVFRERDGLLERLALGHSVVIDSVAALNDSGYSLVALVTDARHVFPYDGESNMTLTATLAEPVDVSVITRAVVKVGGMRVYWGYSPDTCGTPPPSTIGAWVYNSLTGSFSGSTFTSTWSYTTSGTVGNIVHNGRFDVTISDDQTTASFVLDETLDDLDTGCRTVIHLAGNDLPSYPPTSGLLVYAMTNTALLGKVTIQSRETCPGVGCAVVVKSFTVSVNSAAYIQLR